MKAVCNPEFKNARYELAFIVRGEPMPMEAPPRFKTAPPRDLPPEKFTEWVARNSVPQFVLVKD